jgi:multicomponent Na+:H+ antiporter subunit E
LTPFLLNLVLALVYVLLTGDASFFGAAVGFVVGFVIIVALSWPFGQRAYTAKLARLARFTAYFLRILVVANLEVAREIVTPGYSMKPRILRYSVAGLTPTQTTVLANAITLTPGTLTADLSPDSRYLYIHAMYAQDRDAAIAQLDELKERVLREVFG